MSPLPTRACSILSSVRSIVLSLVLLYYFSYTCSLGLLFSRPYSLTLRAVILFTALLLRDATVFIFVDRFQRLLQESSSRPQILLRLSSSRRPTVSSSLAPSSNLRIYSRCHISSLTPVRPDYSHHVPRGCCFFLKYSIAHPSVHRSVACRWWRRRPY